MVSFENFVKSTPPSLSELKVTPNFFFPFKITDDPTATNIYPVDVGNEAKAIKEKKYVSKLLNF